MVLSKTFSSTKSSNSKKNLIYSVKQYADEVNTSNYESFLTSCDIRTLPPVKSTKEKESLLASRVERVGFDKLNSSITKAIARMGGDLDDRWNRVSDHIDTIHLHDDSEECAKQLHEVYTQASKLSSKLEIPNIPLTAVACSIMNHVLYWYGKANPRMVNIASATRQILYKAIFPEDTDPNPGVLTNDSINSHQFEALTSAYMKSTYFDLCQQYESLLKMNEHAHLKQDSYISKLQAEVDYWKESYTKKIFQAWRVTSHQAVQLQREKQKMSQQLHYDAKRSSDMERQVEHLSNCLIEEQRTSHELRQQSREQFKTHTDEVLRLKESYETEIRALEETVALLKADHRMITRACYDALIDIKGHTHAINSKVKQSIAAPTYESIQDGTIKVMPFRNSPEERLMSFYAEMILLGSKGTFHPPTSMATGPNAINEFLYFIAGAAPSKMPPAQLERLFALHNDDEKLEEIAEALKDLKLTFIPITSEMLRTPGYDRELQYTVVMISQRLLDPLSAMNETRPSLRGPEATKNSDSYFTWTADQWQRTYHRVISENLALRIGIDDLTNSILGRGADKMLVGEKCGVLDMTPVPQTLEEAAVRLGIYNTTADKLEEGEVRDYVHTAVVLAAPRSGVMSDDDLLEATRRVMVLRSLAIKLNPNAAKVPEDIPPHEARILVEEELVKRGMEDIDSLPLIRVTEIADEQFRVDGIRLIARKYAPISTAIKDYASIRDAVISYMSDTSGEDEAILRAKSDKDLLELSEVMLMGGGLKRSSNNASLHISLEVAPGSDAAITGFTAADSDIPINVLSYLTKVNASELNDLVHFTEHDNINQVINSLKGLVQQHIELLSSVYRYYSGIQASLEVMSFNEYYRMCKDLGLQKKLGRNKILEVFKEANKSTEQLSEDGSEDEMMQGEFVEALIRLSNCWGREGLPIVRKFRDFIGGVVQMAARRSSDEFKNTLRRQEVRQILRAYDRRLKKVFQKYTNGKEFTLNELKKLLKDSNVIDARLTYDDIKETYNWSQDGEAGAMNFSEFSDSMVVFALTKYPLPFLEINSRISQFFDVVVTRLKAE